MAGVMSAPVETAFMMAWNTAKFVPGLAQGVMAVETGVSLVDWAVNPTQEGAQQVVFNTLLTTAMLKAPLGIGSGTGLSVKQTVKYFSFGAGVEAAFQAAEVCQSVQGGHIFSDAFQKKVSFQKLAIAGFLGVFAGGVVNANQLPSLDAPSKGTIGNTWRTQDFLDEVWLRAERKVGGTGAVAGTEKHAWAAKLIERYQSRFGPVGQGLPTEQSYLGGQYLGRSINLKVSVRLDVVEGAVQNPTAVYDFKFTVNTNPTLSLARITAIRSQAGLSPVVPIKVVKP